MAVINGNDSNNNLTGTDSVDTIKGFGGNDTIKGLGGNDKLYGGDTLGTESPSGATLTVTSNVISVGDEIAAQSETIPGRGTFYSGYGLEAGQIGILLLESGESHSGVPATSSAALAEGQSFAAPVGAMWVLEYDDLSVAANPSDPFQEGNDVAWFGGAEGRLSGKAPNDLNFAIDVPVTIGGETQTASFSVVPVIDTPDRLNDNDQTNNTSISDSSLPYDASVADFTIPAASRTVTFSNGAVVQVDLRESFITDNYPGGIPLPKVMADFTLMSSPSGGVVAENDTIFAGTGDDLVLGESGNDYIQGELGNDEVRGGDGDDTVAGGRDNDKVFGGDGFDSVRGGPGRDQISGGSGSDRFLFDDAESGRGTNADSITDFRDIAGNDDVIDLSLVDANSRTSGDQAFFFGGVDSTPELREVSYYGKGRDTIVAFNNGQTVGEIRLANILTNLGSDDIVL